MEEDADSPFSSILTPSGATNPELAKEFLKQHRTDMAQRQPDIDNVLSKMQLTTDNMTKMLEDTTNSIKASRNGQVNLPLLALASGLMGPGNFGQQASRGLQMMIPTIQRDREQEDQTNYQLAQLGMRGAMIAQAPLEAKLAYMKALQTGDIAATRAIEQALIRAQGQQSNSADNPKLIQKTINDALGEARKQVDAALKDADVTPEEKDAEVRRRFTELIKAQRAGGIKVPEGVEAQIFGEPAPGKKPGAAGVGPYKFKSYFDAPNSPEREKYATELGLPVAPPTYEGMGRTERTKALTTNTANWQKESKDFDEESARQRNLLDQINNAETILDRRKDITGPRYGLFPNQPFGMGFNYSADAQTLKGVLNAMQLHNVPKGQGAVSNMERELFASAGPNMEARPEANRALMDIQKEIIARDKDRREFFTQYFNNYKTTDGMVSAWDRYIYSPEGSAFKRNPDGTVTANTSRTPWREFFKKERTDVGGKKDGGPIKLGPEHDE